MVSNHVVNMDEVHGYGHQHIFLAASLLATFGITLCAPEFRHTPKPPSWSSVRHIQREKTSIARAYFAAPHQYEDAGLREKLNETKQRKAALTAGDIAGYSPSITANRNRSPSSAKGISRSAVRELGYRWPGGEIPYVISEEYSSEDRKIIAKAMDEFQKKTCLRFVQRESHKQQDYLYFEPVDGCYSFVGRIGGAQQVSLAADCMHHGIIAHELMHAVGFIHEQNRSDRDRYVKVLWKNILSGSESEFDKQADQLYDTLGFPYDYNSIMHYELTAFSRNGKPVMELLRPAHGEVGQRDGLNALDVQKINRLYNCRKQATALYSTKEEGNELPSIFPELCEDLSDHCVEWSRLGYCVSALYRPYAENLCRRSCGRC